MVIATRPPFVAAKQKSGFVDLSEAEGADEVCEQILAALAPSRFRLPAAANLAERHVME